MKAEYTTLQLGVRYGGRDPRERELEQATKGLGMELNL